MASIIGLSPMLPIVLSIMLAITSGLKSFFENTVQRPGKEFRAGCVDDNHNISWTGPDGPLNGLTKPRVEVESYGTILVFANPVVKQSGTYICSTEADSKLVHILIKMPMAFADTPVFYTVKERSDVLLKCEIKGPSNTTLSWYIRGAAPKGPTTKVIADGLMIMNVTKEDAGVYTCKATESISGEIKDIHITLKVLHKPYPTSGSVWVDQESAWGVVGSTVNLSCEAIAVPPAKFTWRQPIANHGKILNGTNFSILQVEITNKKVFGEYTCQVNNSIGGVRKNISLEPGELPPPPDVVDQRGENSDTLDIGIMGPDKPTGLMAPTGYVVEYRLLNSNEEWREKRFNVHNQNTYTLHNLRHNSKYELRVATKNLAGQSEFTNTSSKFFTLENVNDGATPDGAILLQHVLLMMSVLLLLNW